MILEEQLYIDYCDEDKTKIWAVLLKKKNPIKGFDFEILLPILSCLPKGFEIRSNVVGPFEKLSMSDFIKLKLTSNEKE